MPLIPTDGRRGGLVLALVAVLTGAVVLVLGIRSQHVAPPARNVGEIGAAVAPGPAAGGSSGRTTGTPPAAPSPSASPSGRPAAPPLGPSEPVRLQIPSIEVDTPVFPIGLAPDGTLAVPQPGPRLDHAAWFHHSPTPGQLGPAIIEGHSDSVEGPSVFFRLAEVDPGDRITVERADGVRVEFRVDAVREFPKSEFPTEVVYGAQDLSRPTLRLITCSSFDPETRHHVGNTVVFAELAKVHRPA